MADSVKASWSPEQLHTFCDICIRAIDMGMRPTTHFDKPGWMYVAKSFAEQTGVVFQRDQFKNKWDSCKKNWRLWNKLIGETGVGWSNELKTIAASDEWWRARIQENKEVKKFRTAGIEPSLKFKFDRMFSGVTATGQHAWAPSSGTVPGSDEDLDAINVGLQGADLEEGSGDSDEHEDINYENYQNSRGIGGEHISSSSNTRSSGKRKQRDVPERRSRKKKSPGIGTQLVSIQQQLLDSISSRSDSTSANKDLPGCSIPQNCIGAIDGTHVRESLNNPLKLRKQI
ncbi:L10-interacting MYB domain-containing protein [Salix suchowensis]|nr:L10-interacting MYB domain-containing protein [Salix suchowensis]